jgi:hypothetical protein
VRRWRAGLGAIGVALAVTVALPAVAEPAAPHPGHGSAADGFAAAMHAAMAKMTADVAATPMTGEPDRDFLAMMIPHHEAAVEMARLVLIHGRDPLVRRLAEEIIAAQQAEILAMRNRLALLQAGRDAEPGGFPALGGTRGPR